MEEVAYWRFEEEAALRDKEIYTALKPGTTTIKNSLIVGISTPHAKQGLLWHKHQKHWARSGKVLLWKSPTWVMNKTLTRSALEAEYLEALGPAEFGAEFNADFREDIEGYIPIHIVDRAIVAGRTDLPPHRREGQYHAFVDAAEGLHAGGDSMTLAISHKEKSKCVVDIVMEFQPPFDPGQVVQTFASVCREYNVRTITQDRHAVGWIQKDFKEYGIEVEISPLTKSQIYELFAVAMNKNQVELVDNQQLRNQLVNLQRFVRSGGIKIDHRRGQHDDLANATAGSVVLSIADEQTWRLSNLGPSLGFIEADEREGTISQLDMNILYTDEERQQAREEAREENKLLHRIEFVDDDGNPISGKEFMRQVREEGREKE